MTAKELASLSAKEVRNNENLMRLYIEKYKDVFVSEPNCASCTFQRDFKKFQNAVLNGATVHSVTQKTVTMGKYQVKRKHHGDIFTYKKDGRPFRSYGRHMTDEFAEAFLTHGTKKEIEARKDFFDKLPQDASKAEKPKETPKPTVTEEKAEKGPEKGPQVEEKPKEVKKDPLPRKKKGPKTPKK